MRYFKNKAGRVFRHSAHHMTRNELNAKIADAQIAFELASQSSEQLDEYESCEYLALQRIKSTKIWIHDDAAEMTAEEIYAHLNPIINDEQLAETARATRDSLLEQLTWRYDRYASETRLGLDTTDSIEVLDTRAQALRDITTQAGFPQSIEWPAVPT